MLQLRQKIAIKTITATKKVFNNIYGFKDLISKQIISQFQFVLGFKISVKSKTSSKIYKLSDKTFKISYIYETASMNITTCYLSVNL
jgi:hypothetical protein